MGKFISISSMSEGELVLIIGDFHIPRRAHDLPDPFKELLIPGRIQHTVCTGNVGNKDTLEWLKSLSPNFVMARGDQDEMVGLPLTKKINIKGVEFGVVHGHSHKREIRNLDGVYYVTPGSATGAYSSL